MIEETAKVDALRAVALTVPKVAVVPEYDTASRLPVKYIFDVLACMSGVLKMTSGVVKPTKPTEVETYTLQDAFILTVVVVF